MLTVGSILSQARLRAGLTPQATARKLGISRRYLGFLESSGGSSHFSEGLFEKTCRLLKIRGSQKEVLDKQRKLLNKRVLRMRKAGKA